MSDPAYRPGRSRRRVAVVGAGVAGLTAAYLLQRAYDVTLYEAEPRLGGHAHTHDVVTSDGRLLPIDSGFIVHNLSTYPNLLRLFGELGIETQPTDMSMSVRCDGCGLEYAGAKGFGGLFAEPASAVNPRFLRMLVEITRFHRRARRLLAGDADPRLTLGAFLAAGRSSDYFVHHFVVPLVSCVWSCPPRTALQYPAHSLFTFLEHHGALRVHGSPSWRTVVGGSRSYVERAAKELTATELCTPVRSVRRVAAGIELRDDADDVRTFDAAVVATHAEDALSLLADPTPRERAALGAFGSSTNETILHTDAAVLPTRPRVGLVELPPRPVRVGRVGGARQLRHEPPAPPRRAGRLRRHAEPWWACARRRGPGPDALLAPGVHRGVGRGADRAPAAERRPHRLRRRVSRVGLPRGRVPLRCARRRVTGSRVVRAARYRTRITHGRTERVGHGFAYRHPMWLVDLDAVPVLPRGLRIIGSFDARDHLGDPLSSIRKNVDAFLGLHDLDVAGGHVLMLANAWSFGYTFNPLSVFWCYDRDGELVAVIAEVHNTYRERHCYLLRPDALGRAEADKAFYVSPFFAVDGRYEMTFTDPRATTSCASRSRCGARHERCSGPH